MTGQLALFPDEQALAEAKRLVQKKKIRSGTFTDNMKLPVHRWFRYSAGFSAEWVEDLIGGQNSSEIVVLDPFAGSGTTLVAAAAAGVRAFGFESHPFVQRIAKAKLVWDRVDTDEYLAKIDFLVRNREAVDVDDTNISKLLVKCYDENSLRTLLSLRNLFLLELSAGTPESELVWLTISAILRQCSSAGTAQWQYVLPKKTKGRVADPLAALRQKAQEIVTDILAMREQGARVNSLVIEQDARAVSSLEPSSVDLVVTSPPYPNNYDYADATRLEMTFWGEIESWSDLQHTVRHRIVRSCSQHTAAERLSLDDLLQNDNVSPIRDELAAVCRRLESIRLTKGGRKTYHTMIAAYYSDLSQVLINLRPLCAKGSTLCFVIGDSAPYGIHAPAVQWFWALALSAGFHSISFEKLRDRNIKWKNRKHSVPLLEGRLWFKG